MARLEFSFEQTAQAVLDYAIKEGMLTSAGMASVTFETYEDAGDGSRFTRAIIRFTTVPESTESEKAPLRGLPMVKGVQ